MLCCVVCVCVSVPVCCVYSAHSHVWPPSYSAHTHIHTVAHKNDVSKCNIEPLPVTIKHIRAHAYSVAYSSRAHTLTHFVAQLIFASATPHNCPVNFSTYFWPAMPPDRTHTPSTDDPWLTILRNSMRFVFGFCWCTFVCCSYS